MVVENDEFGHKNTDCENKRMMQLFIDCGNRPIVFLRFNPDGYVDADDNKHSSVFYYNSQNILVVDEDEFDSRYVVLKERIELYLTEIPDKEVTVEYLYYSES